MQIKHSKLIRLGIIWSLSSVLNFKRFRILLAFLRILEKNFSNMQYINQIEDRNSSISVLINERCGDNRDLIIYYDIVNVMK